MIQYVSAEEAVSLIKSGDIVELEIWEVENEERRNEFRPVSPFQMLFHILTHKIE